MIAYLYFFHMVCWSFILGQGWLLSNNFFFIMSKLSSSKFCQGTQSSADESIVALLWKLPQMQSCSTNNANLENTNFDTLYKTDCWAAIHGRIRMNNVPNEANYAIMHWIIFVKYLFFQFWEILGQTRDSFYATQSTYLLRTWGK